MSCVCYTTPNPPCRWCKTAFKCSECDLPKRIEFLEITTESGACVCSDCVEAAINNEAEVATREVNGLWIDEMIPESEESEHEKLTKFFFGNRDEWSDR